MLKNGMMECSVCRSKLTSQNTRAVSKAYDKHRSNVSSKHRALNVLLVVGDCVLVGFQVFGAAEILLQVIDGVLLVYLFNCVRLQNTS